MMLKGINHFNILNYILVFIKTNDDDDDMNNNKITTMKREN